MSAPIPEGHRTTAKTQTGDKMEIAISCQDANRIIVALEAQNKQLREALERLAQLGAEPHYGNSIGNDIARAALAATEKEKA